MKLNKKLKMQDIYDKISNAVDIPWHDIYNSTFTDEKYIKDIEI